MPCFSSKISGFISYVIPDVKGSQSSANRLACRASSTDQLPWKTQLLFFSMAKSAGSTCSFRHARLARGNVWVVGWTANPVSWVAPVEADRGDWCGTAPAIGAVRVMGNSPQTLLPQSL